MFGIACIYVRTVSDRAGGAVEIIVENLSFQIHVDASTDREAGRKKKRL